LGPYRLEIDDLWREMETSIPLSDGEALTRRTLQPIAALELPQLGAGQVKEEK
jgi:hypothetical protein